MSWKLKVPQPFVFVLFSFSTCVCFKFQKLSTRIVVLKICAHTNTLVVFFLNFISLSLKCLLELAHQILSFSIVNNFFFVRFEVHFFLKLSPVMYRVLSLPCSTPCHFVLFKEKKIDFCLKR